LSNPAYSRVSPPLFRSVLDRIYELTSVTVALNYSDLTVFTHLLHYPCPSHWLMSNSIYSTTVSPAGVVTRRSRTTPCWNKRVQYLTPCPRLLHSQPLPWSWPTSLISDSIPSQPAVPTIESNPFISQSNPSAHLPSADIINTLHHLSNTLGQPPIAPPVKVRVPDVFDRTDPHRLHHFLFQCCLYFHSGPAIFKSDDDKINFAMTYVSGMVQDWLQVALEQKDRGVHHARCCGSGSFLRSPPYESWQPDCNLQRHLPPVLCSFTVVRKCSLP